MAVRLTVLAVCVAAVAVLAARRAAEGCREARRDAFALAVHGAPAGGAMGPARALRADCHDADELAGGAASLLIAGRRADALGDATRRAPDAVAGWVVLEAALRRADPGGARRAEARARAQPAMDRAGAAGASRRRGSLRTRNQRSTA